MKSYSQILGFWFITLEMKTRLQELVSAFFIEKYDKIKA
jgi:hypothetical protein